MSESKYSKYVVNKMKTSKYDVYVDRPTIWVNPFKITKTCDRDCVIKKYKEWIIQPEQSWLRKKMRKELKNKILACFCNPLKCHAEIIAQIANRKKSS